MRDCINRLLVLLNFQSESRGRSSPNRFTGEDRMNVSMLLALVSAMSVSATVFAAGVLTVAGMAQTLAGRDRAGK